MKKHLNSVIIGSGSHVPKNIVKNSDFLDKEFYDASGQKLETPTDVIIEKFVAITEIEERRWVDSDLVNSDIAAIAGQKAIDDAKIDPNDLDYILVAHNFGDVKFGRSQADFMPSIAAKVKNKLDIRNGSVIPYDVIYGCPGWIEAMRMADNYIKSGLAKNILVIGSETLSRVIDPFDRDSMIFADGAGAVVLSAEYSNDKYGILSHNTISDNNEELDFLFHDGSFNKEYKPENTFMRMIGRKIYEYALKKVPDAIKLSLDHANIHLDDTSKLLIHQANGKMDEQILKRFVRLYKGKVADNYMPMTISKFGNSSVATVPTLFDLINKREFEDHEFNSGDNIIFASVGAGMTINSMVYRMK
ncbi:MAG: 3-oxoacyl-ACP synthase III family protein [Flavobacteriales bacterium]|nr:3-oxoacyl-ACP synthase III family protein [Flavobacteriales bacterium]